DPERQPGQGGVGDGDGDETGAGDLPGRDPQLLAEPGGEGIGGGPGIGAEPERQAGVVVGRRWARAELRVVRTDRAPQPGGDHLRWAWGSKGWRTRRSGAGQLADHADHLVRGERLCPARRRTHTE